MLRVFVRVTLVSVIILLVVPSVNAGLEEELVFYLTFDNITDQTVVDKSDNGLDAEIIENTEIVKGKYGDAIHITDQGQDCVNIPSREKLKVTDEITMMTWIYYQEAWKGQKVHWIDKGCHWFAVKWGASYGIGSIDIGNGPEIWLFLGARNEQGNARRKEFRSPHKMGEKKWHHVAGSYDGQTMKIYLDGEAMGEQKKEFDFVGDNNASLWIGCARNKYAFVNGSIDEVAVWRRALNDNEIQQAMKGDFLAVSPSDKAATTWADVKSRATAP